MDNNHWEIHMQEIETRVATLREVPAVKRAVSILFHLAETQQPLTLSQIARDMEIIPSSCLHILRELVSAGLVTAEIAGKAYSLGPAVLALAARYNRNSRFVELARPAMEEVARAFHLDVSAHVSDGIDSLVVVATTGAAGDVQVRVPLGYRFPLLTGASGRCIAAFNQFTDADLKKQFLRVRWQRPLSFARWQEQVATTRQTGIGIDDGCYRKGLTTIAVPVFPASGRVIRFIGALGITAQLTATSRRQLTIALKKAAAQVASDLNGMTAEAA